MQNETTNPAVDVLAVIDAEIASLPAMAALASRDGTECDPTEALRRLCEARAAIADVYAQRDALVEAGEKWVRAAIDSNEGITANEKAALDTMIAALALARCGGTP